MSEETFHIFSGAPEEYGSWVAAIERLSSARQRMEPIAAEKRDKYFLFSSTDQSILTEVDTRFRTMIAR